MNCNKNLEWSGQRAHARRGASRCYLAVGRRNVRASGCTGDGSQFHRSIAEDVSEANDPMNGVGAEPGAVFISKATRVIVCNIPYRVRPTSGPPSTLDMSATRSWLASSRLTSVVSVRLRSCTGKYAKFGLAVLPLFLGCGPAAASEPPHSDQPNDSKSGKEGSNDRPHRRPGRRRPGRSLPGRTFDRG